MRIDDEIDLRLLDGATKLAFGWRDRVRGARSWYRRHRDAAEVWRLQHPDTFDQLAVIVAAGILECLAALLRRK